MIAFVEIVGTDEIIREIILMSPRRARWSVKICPCFLAGQKLRAFDWLTSKIQASDWREVPPPNEGACLKMFPLLIG